MATRIREMTKAGARRLGIEDELVSASERIRTALQSAEMKRNAAEDERVRLVAACVLRADSNCVDVGANVGSLLEMFTEVAPSGRHIAYEPVPWLADDLERRFPSVTVRRAAASDESGDAQFVVHRELPSRSSLQSVGYAADDVQTIDVRLETLDSDLPAGYVPDLLKIDVEGAEHLVLRGALDTLREHRPLVLFEHQRKTAAHYGSGPDEIHALLVDEAGYRIFDMDGAGPYSRAQFAEVYETGARWNFLASG
jgi:FkbM family methyltransferase